MSGVLQLEIPTPTLWPDIGAFGVLMPESGPGVLFVGSQASGVLLLEGDDVFLAPATTQTFLLTVGEPGLPGPQQFYLGGSEPAAIAVPILWLKDSDAPNAQAGDYDLEVIPGV